MCSIAIAGLALTLASSAVSFIGQQQQAKAAKKQARFQQALLRNQQIAKEQDIAAEQEAEQVRQQLISREGRLREGEIRTAQAGLGQLVDVGSAADITAELAGEVAFKKLISRHESDLRQRNLALEASNIQGDIALTGLRAENQAAAAKTASFGTLLSTGSKLAGSFGSSSGFLSAFN